MFCRRCFKIFDQSELTVQDIIDSMSDAQKRAMYIVIGNEILKTFTGQSKISYQSILRECLEEKYTIQEVLDSMTNTQKSVIFLVVKEALEKAVCSELKDLQKLLTNT